MINTMSSETVKDSDLPSSHAWIYPESSDAERVRRWHNVRKLMVQSDLDCLLIPGSDANQLNAAKNVQYISNYVTYSGRTYVIFPADESKEAFLSLGHPEGGVPHQRYVPARYHSWIRTMSATENQGQEVIGHVKKIGLDRSKIGIVDPQLFPAPFYDAFRRAMPEAKLEIASRILTSLRAVLSDEEISMLKEAARILDLSYEAAIETARPGIKECELWGEIEKVIIGNGGFMGHANLITSFRKPSFPMSPPSHRILEEGDTIIAETSSIWAGYTAQIAYAFSLGEPEKELVKMHSLCSNLYDEAISMFNDGKPYKEVKQLLDKEVRDAGYLPMTPQVHLDLGEQDERVKPGQNFVLHPCAVTKDYHFGMKIGDHIVVDKSEKARSVMKTPHDFRALSA